VRRGATDWLAGVLFGIVVGAIFLAFPLVAIAFVVAIGVISLRGADRVPVWPGIVAGAGAGWLGLLGLAAYSCLRLNSASSAECAQPDPTPWVVGGVALLVIGIAGTLIAVIRRDQRS